MKTSHPWTRPQPPCCSVESELRKARAKVDQNKERLRVDRAALSKLLEENRNLKKKLTAKKPLEETREQEPLGSCEVGMTDVLAERKIISEVYWGGAFIGPAYKILTQNAEAIFSDLRTVLKKFKKDEVTDEFVDKIVHKYDTLLRAFENCARVIRLTEMQADEAIDKSATASRHS